MTIIKKQMCYHFFSDSSCEYACDQNNLVTFLDHTDAMPDSLLGYSYLQNGGAWIHQNLLSVNEALDFGRGWGAVEGGDRQASGQRKWTHSGGGGRGGQGTAQVMQQHPSSANHGSVKKNWRKKN